jgi:hypothetical protein
MNWSEYLFLRHLHHANVLFKFHLHRCGIANISGKGKATTREKRLEQGT